MQGTSITVQGTIGGTGLFSGQSINDQGKSGSVTITASNGSIGQMSIASSTINLSASNGNAGTQANPIFVSNSGAGVSVFASATGTASGQGVIAVTDNSVSPETLTINNSNSNVHADVLAQFVVTGGGSINAASLSSTAITSPSVILNASSGQITADGTAGGGPLLINSGTGAASCFWPAAE